MHEWMFVGRGKGRVKVAEVHKYIECARHLQLIYSIVASVLIYLTVLIWQKLSISSSWEVRPDMPSSTTTSPS